MKRLLKTTRGDSLETTRGDSLETKRGDPQRQQEETPRDYKKRILDTTRGDSKLDTSDLNLVEVLINAHLILTEKISLDQFCIMHLC